jgi:hypothetical protein
MYTRAKKIDRAATIEKLVAANKLTPDGADWLKLRLDPFHDQRHQVAGYPDADSFDTVVSSFNYELNVSEPAGLGANWDAHIFTLPFDRTVLYNGNIVDGQFTQTAENYSIGLVTVAKDAAGGPLFPTAVPVASANFSMASVATFGDIEAGASRIIGMAIEIIDTSAELYKQGALTAYRMPAVRTSPAQLGYLNTAGTMQSQGQFTILQAPPSTVAEAILYRSSVQWEARDGAYLVVGQEGVNNPFTYATRDGLVVTKDAFLSGTDLVLASDLIAVTALQAPPIMTASYQAAIWKNLNVTQSGIILSGLHTNATFKIRVRVYVERAPQRGDSTLIPLATPSAPFDYKAMQLYCKLVSELPVAVPVSFNAKGDWWRIILRTVAKVAPILGTVLTPFFPEAAAIGNTVGTAAGQISNIAKKKKNNQNMPKRQANARNNKQMVVVN